VRHFRCVRMTDNTRVLVTGADGFIGRHLVPHLVGQGFKVIAASRSAAGSAHNVSAATLPDLSKPFDWAPLLAQCDAVVHLAAVAHRTADDELFDLVNHRATAALAETAARLDKHLVFISSIAAQSGSCSDRELTEDDPPRPTGAYGRSKLAAERAVRDAGGSFTILRPVVIYGHGEKGNLATIRKIARLPIPLPFANLRAPRSVLSVQNLSSAILVALTDARARQQAFIVSDPRPVTVGDLITHYRAASGRPAWIFPAPQTSLELMLKALGQARVWQRIGRPLVAPPTRLMALGWRPMDFSTRKPRHEKDAPAP
jgi:nucleoside-diphosphate-sugar epimerase